MSPTCVLQACRVVDSFVANIARVTAPNKNVELGGRDGFKTFPNGVTWWILKSIRINGGWHVSIARHLRIFFGTTDLLPPLVRRQICTVYDLIMKVHTSLRIPVRKDQLALYQGTINDLLTALVRLNAPHSPSMCNSIKYHWPRHWQNTRRELGCSAHEKSLERKLGETQKKNFKFTNGRQNVEVGFPHTLSHFSINVVPIWYIKCHLCNISVHKCQIYYPFARALLSCRNKCGSGKRGRGCCATYWDSPGNYRPSRILHKTKTLGTHRFTKFRTPPSCAAKNHAGWT